MRLKRITLRVISVVLMVVMGSCQSDDEPATPDRYEGEAAGGTTTVYLAGATAFSRPAPNLTAEQLSRHLKGDLVFETNYVSGISPVAGGLGPVFNNNSCVSCHVSDSRAPFPSDLRSPGGLFLKISIPGTDEHGGPLSASGFGVQLQHQAVYGFQPEALISVVFEETTVELADGSVISLRKPVFSVEEPYMPLPAGMLTSPRIGMPVFGLGLLEAISEADIRANEDAGDADGDSVSGRANYVWDPASGRMALGRFGWKANNPSVLVQLAGAFNQDMGLTNPVMPVENSHGQSNSDTASVSPEVSMTDLADATFYCLTLGVPAARNTTDPLMIEGRKIFVRIGCDKCHIPSFTTGEYPDIPQLAHQKIYPYTDMLLHDMGEGLADNRPDFAASGREWKTRPLWGIGLTGITSGHNTFLHDGRARSLTEAILWHGGEAAPSQREFKKLSAADRSALLKFIESL